MSDATRRLHQKGHWISVLVENFFTDHASVIASYYCHLSRHPHSEAATARFFFLAKTVVPYGLFAILFSFFFFFFFEKLLRDGGRLDFEVPARPPISRSLSRGQAAASIPGNRGIDRIIYGENGNIMYANYTSFVF